MSQRDWWGAEKPPRDYAAALLAMGTDKARQRAFFDEKVPDHLKDMTMDHVKSALALRGNK